VDNVVDQFQTVIGSIGKIGEAFSLFFSGSFKEAFNLAAEAASDVVGQSIDGITNIGKAGLDAAKQTAEGIANETGKAIRLEERRQQLERRRINFLAEEEKLRSEIEVQRNIAQNTDLSRQERLEAGAKALQQIKQLEDERTAIAQENFNILKEQARLNENLDEDTREVKQAEAELNRVRGEAARQAREVETQLRTIRREGAAERQAQLKAEQERVQELVDQYIELADRFIKASDKAQFELLSR